MFNEKAQLHTIEGLAAAAILLVVIVYAIDATSITPLTSSTSNEHIETQLQVFGQDILNTMDYSEPGSISKLKDNIIQWNGFPYSWSGSKYVVVNDPQKNLSNNFTDLLKNTLVKQGIAHNVEITFLIQNGTSYSRKLMIYNGDPSDNAVMVSRKIVLQNTDGNYSQNSSPIVDIDPSTNLYNVVDVKLIMWSI